MAVVLSVMCDADPDCFAFDPKGQLYHKSAMIPDPASVLYLKNCRVC